MPYPNGLQFPPPALPNQQPQQTNPMIQPGQPPQFRPPAPAPQGSNLVDPRVMRMLQQNQPPRPPGPPQGFQQVGGQGGVPQQPLPQGLQQALGYQNNLPNRYQGVSQSQGYTPPQYGSQHLDVIGAYNALGAQRDAAAKAAAAQQAAQAQAAPQGAGNMTPEQIQAAIQAELLRRQQQQALYSQGGWGSDNGGVGNSGIGTAAGVADATAASVGTNADAGNDGNQ